MLPTHRITQGDDADFKVPLLLDGVSAPIDGWTLETVVKSSSEDADAAAVIHCTAANGRVVAQWADAWLVSMPAAVLKAATPGRYYFEHQGKSPAGKIQTLEKGIFWIDAEFTKST